MTGYTKLFNSILGSTIWREDPVTKVAWITLLALANRDGIVEASIPGLAHFAGVSVAEAEAAIAKFLGPDKYSRTPEHDGRRIEVVDGGWRLLNHEKYRLKMSPEDMREQARLRQQRSRDRRKSEDSHAENVTVCDGRDKSRESLHTEAEGEAEAHLSSEKEENPGFKHPGFSVDLRKSFNAAIAVYPMNGRPVGTKTFNLYLESLQLLARKHDIGTNEAIDFVNRGIRGYAATNPGRYARTLLSFFENGCYFEYASVVGESTAGCP